MSAVMETTMNENPKPAAGAGTAVASSKTADAPVAKVKPKQAKKSPLLAGFFMTVLPPLTGLAFLALVWQIIAAKTGNFPTPLVTLQEAIKLFSDPFYRTGPNDQGIGWNVLASLQRVAIGFGLAALVGIPLGFLIGRVRFLSGMFGPMIINTAVGVQRVPQDYMNVARVLNLSEWKILTKILFPSVLPYMLTGVRLAIGTAWLVIVAAEMLTGGVGIGFWVWDEWNNLNVPHIIIAIVVIGVVGLILEQLLVALAKAFTYEQVSN